VWRKALTLFFPAARRPSASAAKFILPSPEQSCWLGKLKRGGRLAVIERCKIFKSAKPYSYDLNQTFFSAWDALNLDLTSISVKPFTKFIVWESEHSSESFFKIENRDLSSPKKLRSEIIIVANTQPIDQRSMAVVGKWFFVVSLLCVKDRISSCIQKSYGARYPTVPCPPPCMVCCASFSLMASPKSIIFTVIEVFVERRRRFAGLISRCTILQLWRYSIPLNIWYVILRWISDVLAFSARIQVSRSPSRINSSMIRLRDLA